MERGSHPTSGTNFATNRFRFASIEHSKSNEHSTNIEHSVSIEHSTCIEHSVSIELSQGQKVIHETNFEVSRYMIRLFHYFVDMC